MSYRYILFFLVCYFSSPSGNFASLSAQTLLSDDFGTSTLSPQWLGNPNHFTLTSAGTLQLNAPTGGVSTLAAPFQAGDSIQFSVFAKMDFAPSLTNLLQIWLNASSADLSTADGYYLEIGENGSNDAIKLMKRKSGLSTLVMSAPAGTMANQPAQAHMMLTRFHPGNWTLSVDYSGGTSFAFAFSALDTEIAFSGNAYFGFYCVYTDTRKDKYFFDDVHIERIQPDLQPPVAVSAEILDPNRVKLVLNEPLTVLGSTSVTATPGGFQTANVAPGPTDRELIATFAQNLASATPYTFSLSGIADTSGNVAPNPLLFQASYILYETPSVGDVVINEIFPDPTPMIGLPDAEFIEFYNRSNKYIKGSDLLFRDGTSAPVALTGAVLPPGSYLVVAAQGAVPNFPQGINITGIASLPTLNNDGETLTLENNQGETLDQITFDLSWYRDAIKDDGGWSLERINPDLECSSSANWNASTNPLGGTPGVQNAVFSNAPDQTAPSLVSAVPQANGAQIEVICSEGMDLAAALDITSWVISPAIPITAVQNTDAERKVFRLTLSQTLTPSTLHSISGNGLADCAGNLLSAAQKLQFGVPEAPQPGDIIINEVLFNPSTGGSRYVELFNRSNKIVQLSKLKIVGGAIGIPRTESVLTPALLLPDSFAVFTPDQNYLIATYAPKNIAFVYKNNIPTLPDDEGTLAIQYLDGAILITIDSFDYQKDWHSPFLSVADQEGVSLERISPDLPSTVSSSWISAAGPYNGTPTYQNSQFDDGNNTGSAADLITLSSQRISPDGDSYEDYLLIYYKTPSPGYFGAITIYDSEGRPVRKIAKAELFGTEGAIRWDGENDEGEIERPGIYLVYIEMIQPDGKVLRSRHTITSLQKF